MRTSGFTILILYCYARYYQLHCNRSDPWSAISGPECSKLQNNSGIRAKDGYSLNMDNVEAKNCTPQLGTHSTIGYTLHNWVHKYHNSPLSFRTTFEKFLQPIYCMGEINDLNSELESAFFQVFILENWESLVAPFQVRTKKVIQSMGSLVCCIQGGEGKFSTSS